MGLTDPPFAANPKRLSEGHSIPYSIPEGADQERVSTQASVSSGVLSHACTLAMMVMALEHRKFIFKGVILVTSASFPEEALGG